MLKFQERLSEVWPSEIYKLMGVCMLPLMFLKSTMSSFVLLTARLLFARQVLEEVRLSNLTYGGLEI